MSLRPNSLTTLTATTARVAWTLGTSAHESWVFVDGAPALVRHLASGTDRTCDLALAQGSVAVVEVHEVEPGEIPGASCPLPNRRPILAWLPDSGTDTTGYRLYLNGTRAATYAQGGTALRQEPCPQNLRDGWNTVRVDTVDTYGVQGSHAAWPHFCWSPLPGAGTLTGASTNGTVTFTLSW